MKNRASKRANFFKNCPLRYDKCAVYVSGGCTKKNLFVHKKNEKTPSKFGYFSKIAEMFSNVMTAHLIKSISKVKCKIALAIICRPGKLKILFFGSKSQAPFLSDDIPNYRLTKTCFCFFHQKITSINFWWNFPK